MREDDLARLAVVGTAPRQVTANCRANHGWGLEAASGTPAGDDQFVADLHHGRPDIVKELYFSDWLQTAHRHTNGAAEDGCFRKGRIENAVRTEPALQARRGLEDSALTLDLRQTFFAAAIGHVLSKNQDAGV